MCWQHRGRAFPKSTQLAMQPKALDAGLFARICLPSPAKHQAAWGKGRRPTVKAASLLVISLMLKVDSLQGSVTTYIVSSTFKSL